MPASKREATWRDDVLRGLGGHSGGIVARLASTVRHLGYLAPSYSQLDGFALTRTLVDHVIAYAWVSADPKERLPAFLRSSFKDILAKDGRCRERGAAPLLGDAQRDHLSAYTRKVNREAAKTAEAVARGRRILVQASPVLAARVIAHRQLPAPVRRHL